MYYHRRPQERRTREYFMPFFMILMLGVILVFGWRILNTFLVSGSQATSNERAFLNIENGSVKAMAADATEWASVPDKIYLYRGEKLKTEADGRASLNFWDQGSVRLDKDSQLNLVTLKRKNETNTIESTLAAGNAWVTLKPFTDADSSFALNTDWLTVNTRGGALAITNPGTVYALEGSATIEVKKDKTVLKTYTLGIGQEFMLTQDALDGLGRNESPELIFAISDSFKQSDWYQWNQAKEIGGTTPTTVTPSPASPSAPVTSPSPAATTAPATTSLVSTTGAPPAPQITDPGKNGDKVTLTNVEVTIKGTVDASAAAVIVNDYQLQKYQPGSKAFSYVASTRYDNLKAGENEFKIYAKNEAGTLSPVAMITLVLPQSVIDAHPVTAPSTAASPSATGTGGVTITDPNGGKDTITAETQIDLKGIVPATTAKVVVNDYALSRYTPGSTAWSYKAYSSMGSLEIGKKNVYVVTAYDAENKELGQDSITIDVQSQGAPVITIPTAHSAYMTNLDELVIGGPVGKWVQLMYVNSQKMLNYIPGSEKWSHTVKLEVGKNTFSVYGETNGVKTPPASIEITYQP